MYKKETLKFYIINEEYIKYISKYDKHVSWNKEEKRPYIGIVLKIENYLYFAPLYSYKDHYNKYKENPSFMRVENGNGKFVSVIRFAEMIPVPLSAIKLLDFNERGAKYRNLLQSESDFINNNKEKIYSKAKKIYRNVVETKIPFFIDISCDFKLLEEKSRDYVGKNKKENIKYFNKIIKEICHEKNIKCDFISKDWIIILQKGSAKKIITGYKFGINDYATASLVDDKYATYEFLNKEKISTVCEEILYSPSNQNDYAIGANSFKQAKKIFEKYDKDVVLKPNKGTCGNKIYHIKDEKVLKEKYEELTAKHFSISIGPFYDIENEYRIIMLENTPLFTYKKIKPVIIGDGKNTIKKLLKDFNPAFFDDKEIENDCILNEGEIYEYDWRFNLSKGAKASIEIDETVRKKVEDIAINLTKSLNIRFCSVDVIKTTDNKYYVMEVNSGVMMENIIRQMPKGYEIAKKIYEKVIDIYI